MNQQPPLNHAHLFHIIDLKLLELLKSLTAEEWERQTIAKKWKVKDVAAHLLDGNIRALSLQRDKFFGQPGPSGFEFETVVEWINQFNNEWVNAAKRISPAVMILLHEATGKLTSDYFASLDLFDRSIFPVDWAGENESQNWLHVAREYTEKWLHQQQIRDAVNKPGIITKELFYPFIDTFMFALPHTYRDIQANEGTRVRITIPHEAGGSWEIVMTGGKWLLMKHQTSSADAELIIDQDTAWKLFSRSLKAEDVINKVTIRGNRKLGETALNMTSVMA
jgi:uncharacterized protein (TIGR03083 family)